MNIRKNIDYNEMYEALNDAVKSKSDQMNMYARIGQIVSARAEKGAAVAAAEYLQENHTDIQGFSPRNLRRMRDFYNTYSQDASAFELAMQVGWTQNVVILEADLTMAERICYLKQVAAHGWSKKVLAESIQNAAHLDSPLHCSADLCYTNEENAALESENEENSAYQPDGTVSEPGKENDGCHVRTGICMHHENRSSVKECRLRQLRYSGWNGTSRLAGYVSDPRRRLCREDVPPDRVYRPPREQSFIAPLLI